MKQRAQIIGLAVLLAFVYAALVWILSRVAGASEALIAIGTLALAVATFALVWATQRSTHTLERLERSQGLASLRLEHGRVAQRDNGDWYVPLLLMSLSPLPARNVRVHVEGEDNGGRSLAADIGPHPALFQRDGGWSFQATLGAEPVRSLYLEVRHDGQLGGMRTQHYEWSGDGFYLTGVEDTV